MATQPTRISYTTTGGTRRSRRLDAGLHRAFVHWLEDAQHRFVFPIRIVQVRDELITLMLDGHLASDAGYLLGAPTLPHITRLPGTNPMPPAARDSEIPVWLLTGTGTAARNEHGWHCPCCPAAQRRHFPTREALWIAHLFEPFLAHANQLAARDTTAPRTDQAACFLYRITAGPEAESWALERIGLPPSSDISCRNNP
ncbi:hypothetical protein OS187_01190 [Xanthomonadaceae bacterium JHOS43]|nr:hypothetical protein [Xanthomonadaceae bacterium JHOS43]